VFDLLATDAGRAAFWAESASEDEGVIDFVFPDGSGWRGRLLASERPHTFSLTYFGETVVVSIDVDGAGGCDLTLTDTADDAETTAGWVSVLLALKAAADFNVDLRNHDQARTWSGGYADNSRHCRMSMTVMSQCGLQASPGRDEQSGCPEQQQSDECDDDDVPLPRAR
jgi:hypothetical protein